MRDKLKKYMTGLAEKYSESYDKPIENVVRYQKDFLMWHTLDFARVVCDDILLRQAIEEVTDIYEELEAECKTK